MCVVLGVDTFGLLLCTVEDSIIAVNGWRFLMAMATLRELQSLQ